MSTEQPANPTVVRAGHPPVTPTPIQASVRTETWRALSAYKQMLGWLFAATLVVSAAMIVLLMRWPAFVIFGVILSGALGAFFSALIRLYNFEELPKALRIDELQALPRLHLLIYSLVPAVVGAIAATVLYAVFAAQLIMGDLFPAFECDKVGECTSLESLLNIWNPDKAKDYAKVLVWSFIAGFAERLVPNTLQSLGKTAQANKAAP